MMSLKSSHQMVYRMSLELFLSMIYQKTDKSNWIKAIRSYGKLFHFVLCNGFTIYAPNIDNGWCYHMELCWSMSWKVFLISLIRMTVFTDYKFLWYYTSAYSSDQVIFYLLILKSCNLFNCCLEWKSYTQFSLILWL